METAIERLQPAGPQEAPEDAVGVYVIFTEQQATIAVLRKAGRLSRQLSARVCLLLFVAVGYPAPLASAWGRVDAAKIRGFRLASSTGVVTEVRVFLCREVASAFSNYLPLNAIVLVGGARHWWRSRAQRLAAQLGALRPNVLFVDTTEPSHA